MFYSTLLLSELLFHQLSALFRLSQNVLMHFTFRLCLYAASSTAGTKSSAGSPLSSARPGGYQDSTRTPGNTKMIQAGNLYALPSSSFHPADLVVMVFIFTHQHFSSKPVMSHLGGNLLVHLGALTAHALKSIMQNPTLMLAEKGLSRALQKYSYLFKFF